MRRISHLTKRQAAGTKIRLKTINHGNKCHHKSKYQKQPPKHRQQSNLHKMHAH